MKGASNGGLLGRTRELGVIDRALTAAAAEGEGNVMAVIGAPGLGKTGLLDAAMRRARGRGFVALPTAGSPLRMSVPYGVVRSLLPNREPDGADDRTLFDGLTSDVLRMAEANPLALLVDDAHCADPASLEALTVLARRLRASPVVLVVAARPTPDASSPLANLLATASPEQTVELAPLSPGHVCQAVSEETRIPVDSDVADACHELTAGNPLRVRLLGAELSQRHRTAERLTRAQVAAAALGSFSAYVQRSLVGHPDAALLLAAAAVLGEHASLARAVSVAGQTPEEGRSAATVLAEAGLVADEHGLEPAHPLLAEAALDTLSAAERSRLHGRAVARLQQEGGPAELIAAHLLHVAPAGDPEIVELLRAGATTHSARQAPATAAAYLARALRELPAPEDIPELLFAHASASARAGEDDAVEHLRRAVDAAHERPELRFRAVRELSAALARRGDAHGAARVLETHIEEIGAAERRDHVLQLELDLVGLAPLSAAMHARVGDRLAADRWQLTRGTVTERALLAARDEHAAMAGGDAGSAVESVLTELADTPIPDRHHSPLHAARPIWLLLRAERFVDAARLIEEGIAAADHMGAMGDGAAFRAQSAHLQLNIGDMTAAEREARDALELAESHAFALARDMAAAFLARALIEQEQVEQAVAVIERSTVGWDTPTPGANHPCSLGAALVLISRGTLRLARGDAGGLDDLLAVGELKRRANAPNPAGVPWLGAAVDALVALGERARAIELCEEPLAAAERWGAPAALAQTLLASGIARGDIAAAERAITLARTSEARGVRAEVEVRAALYLTERAAVDAMPRLAAAAEFAGRCGMSALAARARGALAGDAAAPAADALGRLSKRERDVVLLVVEGMTNAQIADALSVSPRTVQAHIANAMGKTGARRRTELATLALRQGLQMSR